MRGAPDAVSEISKFAVISFRPLIRPTAGAMWIDPNAAKVGGLQSQDKGAKGALKASKSTASPWQRRIRSPPAFAALRFTCKRRYLIFFQKTKWF